MSYLLKRWPEICVCNPDFVSLPKAQIKYCKHGNFEEFGSPPVDPYPTKPKAPLDFKNRTMTQADKVYYIARQISLGKQISTKFDEAVQEYFDAIPTPSTNPPVQIVSPMDLEDKPLSPKEILEQKAEPSGLALKDEQACSSPLLNALDKIEA